MNLIRQMGRRLLLSPIDRRLEALRRRARAAPRGRSGCEELAGFRIEYLDLLSLYMEFKDIFRRRLYHFQAASPIPRILDGGSYIGMAMLYFKREYPQARITCFEPDPTAAAVLARNVEANGLSDVEVVPAALAPFDGQAAFRPDRADAGRLDPAGPVIRPTVRLSSYLTEPVDFLKLNIEGAETDVLEEAADRLSAVRQMAVEYHGWPTGPQPLGRLLDLLDRHGFRYRLNHIDYETNPGVAPPIRFDGQTPWFAIVYAQRTP